MDGEWVTLAVSSGVVVGSLVASVRAWLSARRSLPKATLKVDGHTVELDSASPEDAEKIVQAWLAKFPAEGREREK